MEKQPLEMSKIKLLRLARLVNKDNVAKENNTLGTEYFRKNREELDWI